jgi:hypothetical protein
MHNKVTHLSVGWGRSRLRSHWGKFAPEVCLFGFSGAQDFDFFRARGTEGA